MQHEPPLASIATRLAHLAAMPLSLYPSAIAAGLLVGTLLLWGNVVRRPNVEVDVDTLVRVQDRFQTLIPTWDSGWPWTWRRESDPEYDARPQLLAPGKATVGISLAAIAADLAVIVGGAVLAGAAFQMWRSWRQTIWQLHLRDLLALTTATALLVSWVLASGSASSRQRAVVAARRPAAPRFVSSSAAPQETVRWARVCDSPWQLLSGESGQCVVGLEADGDELHFAARLPQLRSLSVNQGPTSEQLQQLTRLARLESLNVVQPRRTAAFDSALGVTILSPLEPRPELVLPPLTGVRGLSLAGANFRGAGLDQWTALESLDLSGTQIDNTGLQAVGELRRLRLLSLANTRVTGSGLQQLRGLVELEELSLMGTHVSAAGLRHLASLPRLARLSLAGVESDDDSVRALAAFPALVELRIGGAGITERSIPIFVEMRLAQLAIHRSGMSPEQADQLQLALPEGSVHIYPTVPPIPPRLSLP